MLSENKKINKDNLTKVLPGFMELLPAEQILFEDFKTKIKSSYENFGFIPLDTTVIEKSEALLAKAGGETEKQIYRFNKGDNDLSLRFDLTVPLARYVAEHFNELDFPFRRYAIGKVYRAEKPQRGRFRELYQCDIDIIGKDSLSLVNDAEILSIIYSTFEFLSLKDITIRINNRKILNGFFEEYNLSKISVDILRIIDKIEKITKEEFVKELESLKIKKDIVNKILDFIKIKGDNDSIIKNLKSLKIKNETFLLGIDELSKVLDYSKSFNIPKNVVGVDLSIARGLDYYTGTVYETKLNKYPQFGSVCSGGRYDDLAGCYTSQKLPGVGASIGLTRLFDQLLNNNAIELKQATTSKVVIVSMVDDISHSLELASKLRENNINTEVYLEDVKFKKKLEYANKLKIPYIVIIGEDEINEKVFALKNMNTGVQKKLNLKDLIKTLKD